IMILYVTPVRLPYFFARRRPPTRSTLFPYTTLFRSEVIRDLDDFWNPGGQEHFREEEEVLLGTYAEYVDISTIPEIQEMLIEHIQIRARINRILRAAEPDIALIHELGEVLNDHIRKEERVIFPMIEKAIPDERLVELAEYI